MEYSDWVRILGKKPNCSSCIDGHRFTECVKSHVGYNKKQQPIYNFYCNLCGKIHKFIDEHNIV